MVVEFYEKPMTSFCFRWRWICEISTGRNKTKCQVFIKIRYSWKIGTV